MNRLALTGFVERWQTYVGAFVTVAFGVGLVQSSLLLLLSVAGMEPAGGTDAVMRAAYDSTRLVAVTVVSVTLGFGAFLAVFIIASTFAFSVTERRRDLALLRIIGADVSQLRRMLLAEAVVLGSLGAAVGIPVGAALQQVQTSLLTRFGFLPNTFTAAWQPWIVPASLAMGIALTLAGVALAARRAARIDPLDALRSTGAAERPLNRARAVSGGALVLAAIALVVTAPFGGLAGAQAMAMSAGITAALAITVLAPVLVPAVVSLVPRSSSPVTRLAVANLRDATTRSASTAAPLIVLVALVLSQPIAMLSFGDAAMAQTVRGTEADLVLRSTGSPDADPRQVTGVANASTEWTVPVRVQPSGSAIPGMSEEVAGTPLAVTTQALVVDPIEFGVAHPGAAGAVDGLRAGDAAPGPGAAGLGLGTGGTVSIGGRDLGAVRLGAEVAAGSGGSAGVVLPRDLVPPDILQRVPATTFVTLDDDADAAAVATELGRLGQVTDLETWAADAGAAGQDQNARVLVVVMAVGAAYAVIGVVNAIAIATSGRRYEFAVARASGMTRSQSLRAAVLETLLVGGSAILLGAVATATTVLAVLTSTAHVTGVATLDVPWLLVAAVAGGGLLLTGLAGWLTATGAMRREPAGVLLARV
ncbi:ABC transporter permease [Xylanimonas oleitrophica]|uniref:ABC transporter permease n=1 Tax=Xylanimonas oleitrophica TaxID=2607479 RepID=A0A2W5WQF0_9MICO|nr:ABC transporter permease [Xylanimonas oleitrophica]PZR53380.1 ABC transporter permease [Xylanimonas oleitrophica]